MHSVVIRYTLLASLLINGSAWAGARQIDEFQWEGVERIVAIGDLHGDYENYLAALRAAELIDRKGRWAGGATHLVQTGDVPDRGPDTGKIIAHLQKLAKQALRKGGQVHALIGNHEAMNVYGDLRYVSEGEFEALTTRNSAVMRDRYFDLLMQDMSGRDPERFAALPEDYRQQWDLKHPLGWIEHRQAWSPAWNPEGKYANWVLGNKVAIRINDTLFVHGGISGFYCQNSLDSITEKVVAGLKDFDPGNPGVLEDEFGPLWYRGLAGVEPVAAPETVDAVLARHGARHIAVGHTPTNGVIWPRYDGKVVQIDTGISAAYGGHVAYLEITAGGLYAGYPMAKLQLPANDAGAIGYLEDVIRLDPGNPYLQERLELLTHPPAPATEAAEPEGAAAEAGQVPAEVDAPVPAEVPTCGSVQ